MAAPRDWGQLVGKTFGAWTVLGVAPKERGKPARLLCRCSCGAELAVVAHTIVDGDSKRCITCARTWRSKPRTHGETVGRSTSPEWNTWRGMIERCTNPNHRGYPRYGGRGITVCERWKLSFSKFLEDMGRKPSPLHTIDRIDNDRGYGPGNCRWATGAEQNRNRCSTLRLSVDMCAEDWGRALATKASTIEDRLRRGWAPKEALFGAEKTQELADAQIVVTRDGVEVQ